MKARNDLIHFKSGSQGTAIQIQHLIANAKTAIQALDALIDDMQKFDPQELPELQLPRTSGWKRVL